MVSKRSNSAFYRDIDRVAVSRRRIAAKVRTLASQIARAYPDGECSILAALTGSIIFLADLMRCLPLRMRLDVISVCSYPGAATRAGKLKLLGPVPPHLAGKDVLIIDDILDSGQTLSRLVAEVRRLRPRSIKTCVLLRKERPDICGRIEADFVGFDVQDVFVVGYGLDFDNFYRNLPDICVLKTRKTSGLKSPASSLTPPASSLKSPASSRRPS